MITKKNEDRSSALRQAIESNSKTQLASAEEIDIVHAKLHATDSLSIIDDFSPGGDPYNHTGQHTIIKPENTK